jgi:hypothetical protein
MNECPGWQHESGPELRTRHLELMHRIQRTIPLLAYCSPEIWISMPPGPRINASLPDLILPGFLSL